MKMKRIGANVRELHTKDGSRILISYSTPVAMMLPCGNMLMTSTKWSSSTGRQISKWHRANNYPRVIECPQAMINAAALDAGFDESIGQWKYSDNVKYGIKEYNQQHKHQPF